MKIFFTLAMLVGVAQANVFNSRGESINLPYTPWLPYDNYYNYFPADTTQLDPPLVISQKGVYYLNNTGSATQRAVDVWGSTGTVTIAGGYVKAVDGNNGIHINEFIYAFINKVKIVHASTGADVQPGKAIYGFRVRSLVVDHCDISGQSGVIVQESDVYNLRDSVIVRYCNFSNITKVKPNGQPGPEHCHSIHFDGLQNYKVIDMYGNRSVGVAGDANEDVFNINNSWAIDGRNINVYGNLASGALMYPIDAVAGFTGSVFTIEGITHGVRCYKNVFLDGQNALANISEPGIGSYDNIISDNYLVSAGRPRGRRDLTPSQYWAGVTVYQNAGAPDSGRGNLIVRNWIGFVSNRNLSHYYPFPGRQDENNVNTLSKPIGPRIPTQNRMPPGFNYYLPYMPTAATEDSAIKRWDDSLAKAGGYVGVSKPATAAPVLTTFQLSDSIIKLGTTTVYLTTGYDDSGTEAELTSVTYKTTATAIATVARDSTSIYQFRLTGVKLGAFVLTVTFTNAAGEVYSKDFPMSVVLGKPRATTVGVRVKQ